MNFKIVRDRDISYAATKRRFLRVVVQLPADRRQLRRLGSMLVTRTLKKWGHQCAIRALFYRDASEADGLYTVAMMEWAPGGVWGDSDKCPGNTHDHRSTWGWA